IEVMPPETPLAKLAMRMREKDIGAIPVGTKDELQGIVTDRDIAVRAVANGRDLANLTAADIMTKGAICCREDEKVRDVLKMMEQKQI
ncbi:CBS domain-containing protein, partial [Microbacteriaceae bacterium K1510]|nr:CBS domain-containing protein [Microbacteriaceae bacterium K1510]